MKKLMLAMLLTALSTPLWANCGNDNGNGNGCSGNEGPAGPAGQPGSNGLNGQDGAAGLNGSNGKDGAVGPRASEPAKLVIDAAIRLYDGKRVQWQLFDMYSLNRQHSHDVLGSAHNFVFGTRVVLKLGSSYEERLAAAQDARIKALEAQISRLSN